MWCRHKVICLRPAVPVLVSMVFRLGPDGIPVRFRRHVSVIPPYQKGGRRLYSIDDRWNKKNHVIGTKEIQVKKNR